MNSNNQTQPSAGNADPAVVKSRSPKKRRSAIINELSRLSRDGWRNARPRDYLPLERELAAIARATGAR